MNNERLALVGGRIVTPFRVVEGGTLLVEDGKIAELGRAQDVAVPPGTPTVQLGPTDVLAPGFVDLLCHGGAGYDFADDDPEAIDTISRYFLRHGTTGMLASLFAKPEPDLLRDVARVAEYCLTHPTGNILGCHMEGPYLNPIMKGAMNEAYLWQPTVANWTLMRDAARGTIRLMTIAPELPGSLEVMRAAAKEGVVLSIGHTTASYEEIEVAIDNGAAHVTHMFNAMRPLHHRDPSITVAALLHDELKVELIADGIHVHPKVMKLIYKVKGARGIVLVSDSVRAGGMPDGEYEFADQAIQMKDRRAYLPDNTLAGSTLTMDYAVKTMVEQVGVPLTEALRMASLNGAKVLGLEHKGILAVGMDADLVVLDTDFTVKMTVVGGEIGYQADG